MQTLDLPDSLYEQAKEVAASVGLSVEQFVALAVEQKLSNAAMSAAKRQRVQVPLVLSKQPGARQLTNEVIAELLDEEDASA